MDLNQVSQQAQSIIAEVEKAIIGKRNTVQNAVIALLCNGHILIEDIPGVGKTTLAKSLARVIGGDFKRMQFTPDLLPSDITGTSIYNQQKGEFVFRPGPVFANIALADEINRATPKTQSALLEAMEERTVTVDGESRPLPSPFFVIATQNSVEMTGTYPLPEAQLDRFFMRLSLGYPDRESEIELLNETRQAKPLDSLEAKTDLKTLQEMQREVQKVAIDPKIKAYIVDLVQSTRSSNQLRMGASPRGTIQVALAAQAHALVVSGRPFVVADNVKAVAPQVLGHRILARAEGTAEDVVRRLMESIPVPVAVG